VKGVIVPRLNAVAARPARRFAALLRVELRHRLLGLTPLGGHP